MFGFGKKKNQGKPEKKKSHIDKLIMGAIVGGAVGSVIGMTIAPKKGKETREMIAQKGKEIIKKGQDIQQNMKEKMAEAKEKKYEEEEILSEARQHKKGLLDKIKDRIFRRNKKVKKQMMKEDNNMKKIPNEVNEAEER